MVTTLKSSTQALPGVALRRTISAVGVALLTTMVVLAGCAPTEPPTTRELLHLKGTPFERGKRHGEVLGSKVQSLYTTLLTNSLLPFVNRQQPDIAQLLTLYQGAVYGDGQFSYQLLLESALVIEPLMPPEHIEEIKGIAQGSGMDYHEVLILNTFLDTILAVKTVALAIQLGQSPRLKQVVFESGLDADGVDNDGDGKTDEGLEGSIQLYDAQPHAAMVEVPTDVTIRLVLEDADGVDPTEVRIQLDDKVYVSSDPEVTSTLQNKQKDRLEVVFKPATLPAAATVALILQAGDLTTVHDPPPSHARFMRDERIVFTTKGHGATPQQVPNFGRDDGRSLPPGSAFALRAGATSAGEPLLAQHMALLDANTLHKHTVLFVHHPAQGRPFVVVGWAGVIGGFSGMNDEGLAYAVLPSDTLDNRVTGGLLKSVFGGGGLSKAQLLADGVPMFSASRQLLEQAKDASSGAAIWSKLGHIFGWNLLLADASGGLQGVEVDSGSVSLAPDHETKTQAYVFGPDSANQAARKVASVGDDDVRIACHYPGNTDDVMTMPLPGGARLAPQRGWSMNYFRSLRVFHGLGDSIKAGYGTFDVANVKTLLADKSLVDTSNSMNAVVFEPAKRRLHVAMGSVPATDSAFEVFTLAAVQP